jgi:hypothetical protein
MAICCGCVAAPASLQPRKTYNTLVAQLFAGEPLKTSDALDSTLRRKIQKLQEYIQKNPAKIPKVRRNTSSTYMHAAWYPHAARGPVNGQRSSTSLPPLRRPLPPPATHRSPAA